MTSTYHTFNCPICEEPNFKISQEEIANYSLNLKHENGKNWLCYGDKRLFLLCSGSEVRGIAMGADGKPITSSKMGWAPAPIDLKLEMLNAPEERPDSDSV